MWSKRAVEAAAEEQCRMWSKRAVELVVCIQSQHVPILLIVRQFFNSGAYKKKKIKKENCSEYFAGDFRRGWL